MAVARLPCNFGDDPLLLRDVPQVETVQVKISNPSSTTSRVPSTLIHQLITRVITLSTDTCRRCLIFTVSK